MQIPTLARILSVEFEVGELSESNCIVRYADEADHEFELRIHGEAAVQLRDWLSILQMQNPPASG